MIALRVPAAPFQVVTALGPGGRTPPRARPRVGPRRRRRSAPDSGVEDVFVHDRLTGTTDRLSVAIDGSQADGGSSTPAISADGHWVCFVNSATNLLGPGVDRNGVNDVFVRKLE
jgi:hypothetical protein